MASKYRNKKTVMDGITFDSAAEARRYVDLKALEKAGHISFLACQVPFEVAPGVMIQGARRKSPAVRYVADFVYLQGGIQVVEDVKGALTAIYKLKRHLLALRGIHITEVRA